MRKVCAIRLRSSLCNDWDLMKKIDIIAQEHKISTELLIWISFSESEIWTKFKPMKCDVMNNWWWLKAFKQDTWVTLRVPLPYSWCWLYPFESKEEFFKGLANTISAGYVNWGCNDLYCLSSYYVWKPWDPKLSRVQRVAFYINYRPTWNK